jgi:tetratricopeptide (TPR) repeat protein
MAPLLAPSFDPADAELTPEHYFVLTRIDGRTALSQLVLISGFPEDKTIAILKKLRDEGAIYFPGEPPPRKKARGTNPNPSQTGPARVPTTSPKPAVTRTDVQVDERALAEACDLSLEQKRAILIKQATLKTSNLFEVLEVGIDADKRALKRAYFKISKDFHPDRYYGKALGSFRQRLDEIFAVATKAFELLDDDAKRASYLKVLGSLTTGASAAGAIATATGIVKPPTSPPQASPAPRSPEAVARARELFERACQHQVTGDVKIALQEFDQAITLDPQPRYLRRAAEAALRAQELRSAEEYATKAAELDARDAGVRRMLAKVFRATGRITDARRELELASKLDPENAFIAAELDELNNGRT